MNGPRISEPSPGSDERANFWTDYRVRRLRLLMLPFSPGEEALVPRLAKLIADWLGLAPSAAAAQARRYVFASRDRMFHEALVLDAPPAHLHRLLDALTIAHEERLDALGQRRGLLLISLHVDLYSSLLLLWLTRAAARGRIRRLTILLDSGRNDGPGLSPSRIDQLEAGGLGSRATTTLLDRRAGATTARHLLAALRDGGTVLVLPDGEPLAPDDPRAVPIRLGRGAIGIDAGVEQLTRLATCAALPVHIRPRGDLFTLTFGTAARTEPRPAGNGSLRPTLQALVDEAVLPDPGLWAPWPRLAAIRSV